MPQWKNRQRGVAPPSLNWLTNLLNFYNHWTFCSLHFLKELLFIDLCLPLLSTLHITLMLVFSCLGLFAGHDGRSSPLFIYLAVLGHNCSTWDLYRFFSYGMWDLVPWPGIEAGPLALGAKSLNHWTTREVPRVALYDIVPIPGMASGTFQVPSEHLWSRGVQDIRERTSWHPTTSLRSGAYHLPENQGSEKFIQSALLISGRTVIQTLTSVTKALVLISVQCWSPPKPAYY